MTKQEEKVCDLAIKWRQSRYAVEEALIEVEFKHAIDMLIKERRDSHENVVEKQG